MERITFDGNFCDIIMCHNEDGSYSCEKGTCDLKRTWERLKEIENILGKNYDLDRLKVLVNQSMTMREEVSERFSITKDVPVDRLRELTEAERTGRCVVLPKDGMVYYIEEAGGEKWVANKPIQQITVKCGWGLASLEFSLLDTGKYFSREAAEAALKGESNDNPL